MAVLTVFINRPVLGWSPANLHPSVRQVFYGETLCALEKKGSGVRAIAVSGGSLRKQRFVSEGWCRPKFSANNTRVRSSTRLMLLNVT